MTIPVTGRFVQPAVVVTHFHLREGDVVADFGTGSGFFLPVLAAAVGSSGHVYACEIQKTLVERVGEIIRTQNLQSVSPLWCDLEEPDGIKIESETVDVGLLINALFMLDDKSVALTEMVRTIRTGGKLYIVDWSESFAGLGPEPATVVSKEAAIAIAEASGLVFETEYPAGDHHYGLAFRKV